MAWFRIAREKSQHPARETRHLTSREMCDALDRRSLAICVDIYRTGGASSQPAKRSSEFMKMGKGGVMRDPLLANKSVIY